MLKGSAVSYPLLGICSYSAAGPENSMRSTGKQQVPVGLRSKPRQVRSSDRRKSSSVWAAQPDKNRFERDAKIYLYWLVLAKDAESIQQRRRNGADLERVRKNMSLLDLKILKMTAQIGPSS